MEANQQQNDADKKVDEREPKDEEIRNQLRIFIRNEVEKILREHNLIK